MNPEVSPIFSYVREEPALAPLVKGVSRAGRVGLDTEADSLHHYYEKVCLLQLAIEGEVYLVDPLVGMDLSPLLGVLAAKPLVLHGADYDLRMLRMSFGFGPRGEVFDTMVAARLLGYGQVGLAALAEQFFGQTLGKHGRKSDWSGRPLTPQQQHYAAEDARWLEPLADALAEQLRNRGRLEWHREACRAVVEAAGRDSARDPDRAWRIKGTRLLSGRQMAFLRELWLWRETAAQKADRPPFRIMGNQLLLELAVWASSHPHRPLSGGPKLPRHIQGGRLRRLEAAMRKARALPASAWPDHLVARRTHEPECKALVETLRAECLCLATQLGIDPSVLAPRAALKAIARHRPETIEAIMACGPLMGWQAQLLEGGIRRVLRDFEA